MLQITIYNNQEKWLTLTTDDKIYIWK